MDKKQNLIPLQELNLTSRFLFDEVPRELAEFLHYLEETTDERAASTNSQRIKRIHRRVRKVRLSEEVGVKYMQAWEEKYYEREEGKEEGRKEGREEGREEGSRNKLRELAIKKYHKGMSVEEIADWTEESPELIRQLLEEKPDPASGQEPGKIR